MTHSRTGRSIVRAAPIVSSLIAAVALLEGCASDRIHTPALAIGPVWQWEATQWASDRTVTSAPERYTLQLGADGTATVVADCNRGRASYEITAAGGFRIGAIALTRMACPPGSAGDRFVQDLGRSRGFYVDNGRLYLEFPSRIGYLLFRPETPVAASKPPGAASPAAPPVAAAPAAAAGAAAASTVPQQPPPASGLLITRSTSKTPVQVVEAIKAYAEARRWRFVGAAPAEGDALLATVCVPELGGAMSAAGPHASALLPCANVSVRAMQGKTEIAVLHPRYMPFAYPHPATDKAADMAAPMLDAMLDAVSK